MITRFIIENFKAIGPRVEIDLRPITLLFGPNSAGKSSIIHALHYAHHLLFGGSADLYRTPLSGHQLDLGGFSNFVHGRDRSRTIWLGFEQTWNPPDDDKPFYYLSYEDELIDSHLARSVRPKIFSHRVQLAISIPEGDDTPRVTQCHIDLNDEPIARLLLTPPRPFCPPGVTAEILLTHPLLEAVRLDCQAKPPRGVDLTNTSDWVSNLASKIARELFPTCQDLAPDPWLPLPAKIREPDFSTLRLQPTVLPGENDRIYFSPKLGAMHHPKIPSSELNGLLNAIICEPLRVLRREFFQARHVGPWRVPPPRREFGLDNNLATQRSLRGESWYDGSAAWVALHPALGRPWLVVQFVRETLTLVNFFLHESGMLEAGFRLRWTAHRTIEDNREEVEHYHATHDDFFMEEEEHEDEGEDEEPAPQLAEFVSLLPYEDSSIDKLSPEDAKEKLKLILKAFNASRIDHRLVMSDVIRGIDVALEDVGVGISQAVPVLVALLEKSSSVRIVEQPELHLHPKAQVSLGDALVAGVYLQNPKYGGNPRQITTNPIRIVETHSEHLLLRLLRRIRQTSEGMFEEDSWFRLTPDELAVVYVEPPPTVAAPSIPGGPVVRRLRVDESGEFIDRWPRGFFEERAEELFG